MERELASSLKSWRDANMSAETVCIECGQRNPKGMFCPMSESGEGPHKIRTVQAPITMPQAPSGAMPRGAVKYEFVDDDYDTGAD